MKIKHHSILVVFLTLLSGLVSCKKPSNYPQSLFSEAKVDSLLNARVNETKFHALDLVFPPPKGEKWYMVSWIIEYRGLKDRLEYNLKQRLPELDPIPYLNALPVEFVDELQWALVLLAQNDPNNSAVIFFDREHLYEGYPELFNTHTEAAFAKEIMVRIQRDSAGYRKLTFIDKETILFPQFHLYGEALPSEYVDDNALTLPYGFKVKYIAGCDISQIDLKKTIQHNQAMFDLMKKRYGQLWYLRFKEQTGKQLYLEIDDEYYLRYK